MAADPMQPQKPRWQTLHGLCVLLFLAVIVFYLLTEHGAHVYGALPFLLLFGCLFLHKFMHGGHGQDHGQERPPSGRPVNDP